MVAIIGLVFLTAVLAVSLWTSLVGWNREADAWRRMLNQKQAQCDEIEMENDAPKAERRKLRELLK